MCQSMLHISSEKKKNIQQKVILVICMEKVFKIQSQGNFITTLNFTRLIAK